jgi:hypothetical protein
MRIQNDQENLTEATDWATCANYCVDLQEWYWFDHYVDRDDGTFGIDPDVIYARVDAALNELIEAATELAGIKLRYALTAMEPDTELEVQTDDAHTSPMGHADTTDAGVHEAPRGCCHSEEGPRV